MLFLIVTLTGAYILLAYVLLPMAWTSYEHQRGLAGSPMVTHTKQGLPGDPLNVGLVGSEEEIVRAMTAAAWFPADPVTLKTGVEIVGSVLLDRPYAHAPVSPLFYGGVREGLAFEREIGRSAHRRHHVRLWRVLERGQEGRPVWLGAVTLDSGVGLSHYTGAVTHRIDPDIDAARDGLQAALTQAGMVTTTYQVTGMGPTLLGRNGEGNRYYTDGDIRMLVLTAPGEVRTAPPVQLENPPLLDIKNAVWHSLAGRASDGGAPPPV